MKFINLLKSGSGAAPITDASNPPETKKKQTSASVIKTDTGTHVSSGNNTSGIIALIGLNKMNPVLDNVLLRIAGNDPVRDPGVIDMLPGVKEKLAQAAGENQFSETASKSLKEIEGVARGMLFESLYSFASGKTLSYPYLDYVLNTLSESIDRTIVLVSTSPEFRNIDGDVRIWVPSLQKRLEDLKQNKSPVNENLIVDLLFMGSFLNVDTEPITLEKLEHRYEDLANIKSRVLKEILSFKLIGPVPDGALLQKKFSFINNLSWVTRPFGGTENDIGVLFDAIDYSRIYADLEKVRKQYKSIYSSGETSNIYSNEDTFYIKYLENASDSDTLVYQGYVGSTGALKISAKGDAITETTLSALRSIYDGSSLLPFDYIQNKPAAINTKEPKGVNGTAIYGLGYWQSTLIGTGNWKQAGSNILEKSLITPVTTYGNNLANSIMSASADAVNAITDIAGNVISDLTTGVMDWATGNIRKLFGQNSGRDSDGRSILLKDDLTQLRVLEDTHGESFRSGDSADNSRIMSALKKWTPSAVAAFDNAVSSIKNTLRSSIGASGEKRRSGKQTDRFEYWRCYSSKMIKGSGWYSDVSDSSPVKYTESELSSREDFFRGYSSVANLSPRVDRYDFRINAPIQFVKKGMPEFMTSYSPIFPKYKISRNENDAAYCFRRVGEQEFPKSDNNLSWQSDLEVFSGLTLYPGEKFSIGSGNEVSLTSSLNQLSRIATYTIEDADLSVRTWMERYLYYMYTDIPNQIKGNTTQKNEKTIPKRAFVYGPANFVPTVSRPIFQGYYYISFYLFDSMKETIQRKRIYYGVPRFDMSLLPSVDRPKQFRIDWDIIGEVGIYGGSNGSSYSTKGI